MTLAYFLYRRRPALEPAITGFWGLLFSGFYLDRLYERIFVRPYQAAARFLWRQIDDPYDRGLVRGTRAVFRPYRAMAAFFWLKIDEVFLDDGVVRAAGGLETLSRHMGRWTSGRLSTYLKMLFLGLTILFGALALTWHLR